MCTALFRGAASRRTGRAGSLRGPTFSCRSQRSRSYSGASSSTDSGGCSAPESWPFAGSIAPLSDRKAFFDFLQPLDKKEWVVYAKAPFRGPDHLLHYLARYTHRVAISNHRLLSFDGESVTFRWKDYAHGNKQRKRTVSANEFLRLFLLHTLPRGLMRIRSFGFLAGPRRAESLRLARQLLPETGIPGSAPAPIPAPRVSCARCAAPR